MKYLLFTILIFVSCNEKKDSLTLLDEELRANAQVADSYRVPFDHPVMKAWTEAKDKENLTANDFNNADALYRKHIPESKGAKNHHNLKEFGFKMVMENGLLEYGTDGQIQFYIDEQMALNANFLNTSYFYELLREASRFMDYETLENTRKTFHEKNSVAIKNSVTSDEAKHKKITNLYQNDKLFSRYISTLNR